MEDKTEAQTVLSGSRLLIHRWNLDKNSGLSEAKTYVLFPVPWISIYKVTGGPKSPSGGEVRGGLVG